MFYSEIYNVNMFIAHPISATSRCSFYYQLSSMGDFCKCHLQNWKFCLQILFFCKRAANGTANRGWCNHLCTNTVACDILFADFRFQSNTAWSIPEYSQPCTRKAGSSPFEKTIIIYLRLDLFRHLLHSLPQRGEQGGVLRIGAFGVHLFLALGGGLRALEVKAYVVVGGIGVCTLLTVIVSP